ncbi:MAG TPA: CpXC domain-containing protein [Chloroflexota bacterium]|nr:CpXC domain-containing protein [Chloroflexota bacterium]
MSKPHRRPFTCSCGETFEADVFKSANVTLQPDLKNRILAGHFNRARCPACGREVDAAVPFLYHDMLADLMVWVYPAASAGQATAIREKIRRSYEIVGSVLPNEAPNAGREVVFGLEELLPLIDAGRGV